MSAERQPAARRGWATYCFSGVIIIIGIRGQELGARGRSLVPGIRIDLFEMAAQVLPAKMRKHRRPWKHRACSKEKYSTFKHRTESGWSGHETRCG